MNRIAVFIFALSSQAGFAQDVKPDEPPPWEFSMSLNSYFFRDRFIEVPVAKANKGKLHLEARYNYESAGTFSGWAGYNFSGGKKVEFLITPMIGVMAGTTRGWAPGAEFTIHTGRFELYTETEYLFDSNANEDNFAYTWSDLTYSFNDHWRVGMSAQRTRLYQTKLDLQRGVLIGTSWKRFDATTYLYNLGFDIAFVLVTLTANF